MPDIDVDLHRAIAREDLCRFLAACYYEPAEDFAQERLFESMQAAAAAVDPPLAQLARRMGEDFARQGVQALVLDYARLFLGPPQPLVRPDGAFWLSGETSVMQDSTLAVQDLYYQAGFELDESFSEVPDHVAAELEFLYLLQFRQNEARRAALPDVLAQWQSLQAAFLADHLGAWIAPFAAAVKANAQTPFYRDLAELTERLVRMHAAV